MLDAATLRQLADLAGPERAFLTVYLDAHDEPSVLESRFERVRALLADQPAEAEHFEESLALARPLIEEHAVGEGSLAVFSSWAGDLRKAYALPEAVGTKVWMGDAPYLRPAAELLDENETYAAVVLDNEKARIYLVSADEVDEEGRVRGDVKNRVKKGGWSQKRYARRRDKQIETYATQLATDLATLDAERPFARLVIVGSDEPARALTAALRQDLQDKLVGSRSVDGNASDAQALEAAADLAEEGERQAEQDLWAAIREQGMGPGLAAFGATSVLAALQAARADALLIARDADLDGTKCRACEAVAHGTPDTCGVCGSSDVFRVDLVEVLTEQATRTGADVDFADPFEALAKVGGVAALLRYSLAENDAEREERERRAQAARDQQERAQREAEAPSEPVAPEPDQASGPEAAGEEPVAEPAKAQAADPVAEPVAEPVVEPTPEPVDEPVPVPVAEPVPEPIVEPVAEPIAEPAAVETLAPKPERAPIAAPAAAPPEEAGGARSAVLWGIAVLVLLVIAALFML
ncbi:Vms1/Ankzf1 family peptidyl-tRNA hydrolase [Rubrivirga sp. IMCC45206]|uniref:baeRF10 domain-containing protein n=1 Tax=Rubrivirga sp. IMCC45206 TaxID=3391614 RepID=UPI00398FD19A